MKALLQRYIYIAGLLAVTALTMPFISIQIKTAVETTGDNGSYSSIDGRLSVASMLWEGTGMFFRSGIGRGNLMALTLLWFFCIVAIIQLIASLLKRYKSMLYTAIMLFIPALLLLLFIYKYGGSIKVLYGYYLFLLLQVLLILYSGKPKNHAKNTTY